MTTEPDLEARLNRLIERHLTEGVMPPIDEAVADRPDLAAALGRLVHEYLALSDALDEGVGASARVDPEAPKNVWPSIPGFRVIERLGAGGMGEVYKVHDEQLDRTVAAKILHADRNGKARAHDMIREARALALFLDPRIVQIFEVLADADPPVIIMEYVDGFELGRVGPSLESRQQAKLVGEICSALGRAHALGIQHRDLKPSNIMLDGRLAPKILDFGLSAGAPRSGHFRGTLQYLAPEQLDPAEVLDARTDVYALGVILYELLSGTTPYAGGAIADVIAAIRDGRPRLPIEIRPGVPEPLQAIALKAMERDPARRYQSMHDMQMDLDRYVEGRPVTARPTQYATTLAARTKPHLDQIAEWLKLRLIYPHEASRLWTAYRRLDAREDDWIVASRTLSYSQIALYLGAFFLFAGSLFYFGAYRFYGAVTGVTRPLLMLGAPLVGLHVAGRWLYRREHRAVGVAFFLAGVSLLPLFLLIFFNETRLWIVTANAPRQLFTDGTISNRQLQATILIAAIWAGALALRTATAALSTVCTLLIGLFALAVVADVGLRDWIVRRAYDAIALHVWPLVLVYGAAGYALERRNRAWFAAPLYMGAAVSAVVTLDLLALDGRLFQLLGVSLQPFQPAGVTQPSLIDTLSALSLNGVLFYLVAALVERRGTPAMTFSSQALFTIAPFSILEPLAYLSETTEYWARIDWLYLGLAVGVAILSQARQRRSFYYAGLLNSGVALYLIADRRQWFGRPSWAVTLIGVGLATLAAGFALDAARRRRRA